MTKEEMQKEQPVAFQMMSNALKNNHLAHAYLFTGPKEACKKEMALLMAKSMSCKHRDENGFACGTCDSCRRIEKDLSTDFFWLKPGQNNNVSLSQKKVHAYFNGEQMGTESKKPSILKEDIQRLQTFFSSSPREGDYQVFLLEDFDTATNEASNSFLKYLEEPVSNTLGILISEHPERMLDTIISRCQQVHFRVPSIQKRIEAFQAAGISAEYAPFFVEYGYSLEESEELEGNEEILALLQKAQEYANTLDNFDMIVELQKEVYTKKDKDANERKKKIRLFLQKLLYEIQRASYPALLKAIMQSCILETLEKLPRPFDPALLMDQLTFRLWELQRMQESELLESWNKSENGL